jgi:Holliday junction DNA helicase RuvA
VIALLRGLVASREEDHIVVDVQGVGYRVAMPGPTIRELSGGEEVTLHIHTHVREDAIQLFGFANTAQREVFLALTKVKGIGPKLGMAVLGHASTADLVDAVSSGDVKRLTHIPGLGKKTAERILVELQGTLGDLIPAGAMPGKRAPGASALLNDVASALGNLGFKGAQIDAALDQVRSAPDAPTDFDGLFREVMKHLR